MLNQKKIQNLFDEKDTVWDTLSVVLIFYTRTYKS